MQVRILCASALGNHVVLQPCYYCNKSQFMIMTQEEMAGHLCIRNTTERRSCIFNGSFCSALCSTQSSTATHVIMCRDVKVCSGRQNTDDLSEQI